MATLRFVLHGTLASATALLSALAPLLVLALLLTICASALRGRLTHLAQRFTPLRGLLWLGVAIHEGGHLLGCLLTLTRVMKVQVKWHSGLVKHLQRGPLAEAVIACGPFLSATLICMGLTSRFFGASFAHAATPLGALAGTDLERWTMHAVHAFFSETRALLTSEAVWHLPALLLLAGVLSSATPSAPDFRQAAPGLLTLAVLLLVAETTLQCAVGWTLIPTLSPALAAATSAFAVASLACMLALALVLPAAWMFGR